MTTSRRPGRRPGTPDTRGQILLSARTEFAARGYDRTTMRAVASTAGVDAALVHHYFGSKDDLFLAALEIPFDPRVVVPEILAPGVDGVGERVVATFLRLWDDPDDRKPLVALFRSVLASDAGADLIRGGIMRLVFEPLAGGLDLPRPLVRAQLTASQMFGLVMVRYILQLQPLASMPPAEVVALIGPTVQRYLTGCPDAGVDDRRPQELDELRPTST